MKIVKPSIDVTFFMPDNGESVERNIEYAARTCYKSEEKITNTSAARFVRKLRKRGHHAMLEFGYATARITADRGLTHELVRHRLASFAQESTRYCNYSKGKFTSEITVIAQPGIEIGSDEWTVWKNTMFHIEEAYMKLLKMGVKPEIARSVLPIGLKAEITIGANLREWRHIFKMRCASSAHPIIRGVMLEALEEFADYMPSIYEDLAEEFLEN
jgi:thymidylate synthase (FAD)